MNGINEPDPAPETEAESGGLGDTAPDSESGGLGDPEPAGPSPEDVEKWTAAVHEIMERDGVTEAQANAGLLWAIIDDEIKTDLRELAEDTANRELWTSVIESLMSRFGIDEERANFDLVALLQWVEDHPGEDFPDQ